ncbi:cell division suppressor protein YneA [Solibacillus silvestris]|uniref:cell division suppressor protein YneA n=1 Tax=Solibacillus silvestris TaxID=76853 RepID=UPI003F7F7146
MKKLRLNSFTSMLLAFSILLFAIIIVKDDKIELYEHVTIEHGDTLWSLAEQYRGKMAKHDWISEVKKENGLLDEKVVFGQVLVVPVEKDAQYIVKLNESSDMQSSVKVVRENNDRN